MEEPLSYEEINSLVYLHATLLETLGLYPSIPRTVRCAISDDILPDRTYVTAGTDIILSMYSVGRMKSVWGEDCLEFKPERWLSGDGTRIERPEDGYNYAAFIGGSRTLKIAAAGDLSETIKQLKSKVTPPPPPMGGRYGESCSWSTDCNDRMCPHSLHGVDKHINGNRMIRRDTFTSVLPHMDPIPNIFNLFMPSLFFIKSGYSTRPFV
ncbi:hypothetical protein RND71_005851 [Anisodus tanguticus]|uniref:Cytochrome P450 n=1 Tax=Anisodus tanguticus TaxID=243964 RepID=A0AAE1VVA9_9SOLA|nr:hypothetical protein RND71_005851 [Anisodus tanguticus]